MGAAAILAAAVAPFAYRDLTAPAGAVALAPNGADSFKQASPIWTTPQGLSQKGRWLIAALQGAGREGLDPSAYHVGRLTHALAKASGGPQARMRAERLLSQAYVRYERDLRTPTGRAQLIFIDQKLRPAARSAQELLAAVSAAPHGAMPADVNPLYAELLKAQAWYRDRWGRLPRAPIAQGADLRPGDAGARVRALRRRLGLNAAGEGADRYDEELASAVRQFREVHGLGSSEIADAATIDALNSGPGRYERIISANLDRLRALPARPGAHYILVDIPAAELRMMEGGKEVGSMRVIVGKPGAGMETPQLAALVRFAVLNPYWNVPPDIVRNAIAPHVLAEGPDYITAHHYELLSGWSKDAQVLAPAAVDWQAVAEGDRKLRVRQLPGPDNIMGRIKFMFPNRFGVYLHDTAGKANFRRSDRLLSHGCVRVEDARRLARWLLGPDYGRSAGDRPEARVPLPQPVPVYLLYLTAVPDGGKVRFLKDPYGLDEAAARD
jgi:murein L,D-transpeptidase YcbB/YkuD